MIPRFGSGSIILCTTCLLTGERASAIDLALADRCFNQAKQASDADGGKLWGKPLYGPMMFVDPKTREIAANQADSDGKLTAKGTVYTGALPATENVANTAFTWSGVRWTMVAWPPGGSDGERGELLIHELWHRIQDDLGLPGSNPSNAHLDSLDGRIWLRLECNALSAALRAPPPNRRKHIENALTFRAYRRSLIPAAATDEGALELNEGLAEYTGLKLNAASEAALRERAAKKLDVFQTTDSFMRSFAYATGPAWAILLDDLKPDWRHDLKAKSDLSGLVRTSLAIESGTPDAAAARGRAGEYRGESIIAEETTRDEKRKLRHAELTAKYVDGPVLRLPFRKMNIQFNPNNLEALGDAGTFYPTLRITDDWGVLDVTGGALIDTKWSAVQVPVKSGDEAPAQGEGWSFKPSSKAKIERGARTGDWTVKLAD